MKKLLLLLSVGLASLLSVARADDGTITKAIEKMGIQVVEVKDSPISNLRTVITSDGIFYATTDGKYLLQSSLFDISSGVPRNVTNMLLADKLEELKGEMIIYKAPKEEFVVTVFTDITCGYCVKLQQEIPEYNKRGITIRYLAFPRQGPDSANAKEMQSIWCMADRQSAFNKATKGDKVQQADCTVNIRRHHELGVMFGVTGTPAMVIGDMLMPGYQDAATLRDTLEKFRAIQNSASR